MPRSNPDDKFTSLLKSIQKILENSSGGVVIGGIATSLLGEPRFTADIDVLIMLSITGVSDFVGEVFTYGIFPRVSNIEKFAKQNRVLPMIHKETGLNVDFIMGLLPFEEEVIKRSQIARIYDISISLPTIEDLIILKAVAHREKDLLDLRGLVRVNKDKEMDIHRIEYWVRQFGDGLDQPDLWDSVKDIFSNQ